MLRVRQAKFTCLQRPDFVAQAASLFELQIGGCSAHLLFQIINIGPQIMPDEVVGTVGVNLDKHRIAAGRVGDDVVNVALDRGRGDPMFDIVSMLFFTAAVGFANGALHAAGHTVGI